MTTKFPEVASYGSFLSGPTIPRLLAAAALQRGTDPYARMGAEELTLGDLADVVSDTQQRLLALGVRRGDRVAVMLPNHLDHVGIIFALIGLRAIWVPVNPKLRGEPLHHQLRTSDPKLIIIDWRYRDQVDSLENGDLSARTIHWGGDRSSAPTRRSPGLPADVTAVDPVGADDVISVMYTSGTTGAAKGVQLTDRMLRAAALGAAITSEPDEGDVFLLWEPLCHIGGAQVLLLPFVRRVRLAMVERFSASRFWDEAVSLGATHIHHLGGILPMLLGRPAHDAERSHRVKVSWGGGMTADSWREAEERFGIRVRECYGMTEASSISTCNSTGAGHGIGRPLPHFDVEVHDDSGQQAPEGATGEIVLRPRTTGLVTPGYLNDPVATAAAWRNGWWHTGDAGRVRDGSLHYVGRCSDSMRHRGENVSAWEIESVVNTHPAVAESALVGVPALGGEQDLLLFISLADGATVIPSDLLTWCKGRLAPYQVPRYVTVVDQFPKTASQRIAKGALPHNADAWHDAGPEGGRRLLTR